MIEIIDKHNCCGCSACVQACPKHCISFEEDDMGFRYPLVDKERCIDCGLCEKVCPSLNQGESKKPLNVYAAINPDEEIRMKSSSGGVFSLLAESVLKDGGVVFGARFNEKWEVVHDYAETVEGIRLFRGSKYVQSIVGQCYHQAGEFLNSGRKVLFTGTPCQISGLKRFLGKEYENLHSVDVVCHGVPSPLVWREYLDYVLSHSKRAAKPEISDISFRDKTTGWKDYGFVIREKSDSKFENEELLHESVGENTYMQLFLKDLCLRPSCAQCPSKCGKSGSDLTIADFWGVSAYYPELDDDKGVSSVLVNTSKGAELIESLNLRLEETTYERVLSGNPSIENSARMSESSALFWNVFRTSGIEGASGLLNSLKPSLAKRIVRKVKSIVSKIR